jgi:hypothetical protein
VCTRFHAEGVQLLPQLRAGHLGGLQLRGVIWRTVAHELLQLSKKTMQQHEVGVADVHLEKH